MITITVAPNGLVRAEGDLIPGQEITLVLPTEARWRIARHGESLSVYREPEEA